jgi:hypothetical protein
VRTRSAYSPLDGTNAREVPGQIFASVFRNLAQSGNLLRLSVIQVALESARGRTIANYMIVRQRETDLTRFQTTFDRLKPDREAAGLIDRSDLCRQYAS